MDNLTLKVFLNVNFILSDCIKAWLSAAPSPLSLSLFLCLPVICIGPRVYSCSSDAHNYLQGTPNRNPWTEMPSKDSSLGEAIQCIIRTILTLFTSQASVGWDAVAGIGLCGHVTIAGTGIQTGAAVTRVRWSLIKSEYSSVI